MFTRHDKGSWRLSYYRLLPIGLFCLAAHAQDFTGLLPTIDVTVKADDIVQADLYVPSSTGTGSDTDTSDTTDGDTTSGDDTTTSDDTSSGDNTSTTDDTSGTPTSTNNDEAFELLSTNQTVITSNQKSMTTNQNTMGNNQVTLGRNQQQLANQNTINTNNLISALEKLIQPDQMRNLLNGSRCTSFDDCDNNDKDFLSFLEDILKNVRSTPASADVTSVMQAMLAALQSQKVTTAYAEDMVELVNQTMSGAGNASGTSDFSVSNVLPAVKDPVQTTLDDFNTAVYPVVAEVPNTPSEFQAASCRYPSYMSSSQDKFACNFYIALAYSGLLVDSAITDWSSANPSGVGNQSGVASTAASSSSSSNASPKFTAGSYPDDSVNGCTSDKFTDAQNESWNGWNATVKSIIGNDHATQASASGENATGFVTFCNRVLSDKNSLNNDPSYDSLATAIQESCRDVVDTLSNNSSFKFTSNFDGIASSGKPMLTEVKGKLVDLSKYVLRLVTWRMYAYNSQPSVSGLVQGYPSMYTLMGYTDYNETDTTAPSTDSSDLLNETISNCVGSLSGKLDKSSLGIIKPTTRSDTDKLAEFYVSSVSSATPMLTMIPTPSLAKTVSDAGASAMIVSNGRFYALDNQGVAMGTENGEYSTTVKVDSSAGMDLTSIIQNQATTSTAISTFSETYGQKVNSLLTQRLLPYSVLNKFYTDRSVKVSLDSTNTCALTPATIRKMNAFWRLDPKVKFCADTGDTSSTCTTKANYIDHIATSTYSENIQEIVLLLSEINAFDYMLQEQNNTMMLLSALASTGMIDDRLTKLSQQSVAVKNLINAYNKGATPSPTMPAGG